MNCWITSVKKTFRTYCLSVLLWHLEGNAYNFKNHQRLRQQAYYRRLPNTITNEYYEGWEDRAGTRTWTMERMIVEEAKELSKEWRLCHFTELYGTIWLMIFAPMRIKDIIIMTVSVFNTKPLTQRFWLIPSQI